MNTEIERIYDGIRRAERRAQAQRTETAYRRAPELAALEQERRNVFASAAAKRLGADEAAERFSRLDARERELLAQAGLPADTLSLHYRCEVCRDTGYVGGASRRPCGCRLLLAAKLDSGVGVNDRETFERFSTEIYRDEGQKKRSVNAKNWCMAYADALPTPERRNVLLLGMPGLGKSYLANAVAYRALGRGIAARRVTAYTFVQDMLLAIQDRSRRQAAFLDVPLLVIDDLGSEPVIPNVSEEALFNLINERTLRNRNTIVVTNLSVAALQERYGERVTSRLTDRSTAQLIRLTGENLRWSDGLC